MLFRICDCDWDWSVFWFMKDWEWMTEVWLKLVVLLGFTFVRETLGEFSEGSLNWIILWMGVR